MRSGSTLLSRMLSAHPDVNMTYDSVNFFRFCYHRYDPISDPENAKRLFKDMAYRLYNRFSIELDVDQCMADMDGGDRSYGQAYSAILTNLSGREGASIVGDKEPLAWTRVPDFLRICPNGKAIVILRDPRDVVTSFKQSTIAPGNDYLIALFNVVDAVNHAYRYLNEYPGRVRVVRFESLKIDTENEVRSVCDFLDLEFLDCMLDPRNYTDHTGGLWDAEGGLTFKDDTAWLAPVGRWKSKIEPEDLYLCEWIAGEQIGRLGLTLDGRPSSLDVFHKAMDKLMSSDLLKEAFKRWCDLGEGSQKFPMNPLESSNWQPNAVERPEAFVDMAQTPGD